MSGDQAHRDYADSVGAYALGALPELEAQVFERHLMACEPCQEELQRLTEAVEALPRSVTPHVPPPSLKTSLMDAVNAEAGQTRPSRARWWPEMPRFRPAVAWAAAACVLGLGLLVGYGVSELARDGDDSRTLTAQVDAERLPGGSATVLLPDDGDGDPVLRAEGLPDPGDRVYQVWIERGGEVQPGSVIAVDSSGVGAAALPASLDGVSAVMVTREPRPGRAMPSEAPVLRIDV